ncbi:MAG: hypothetical protein ABIU77_24415 [Ferruginibacter sp.]
MAQKTNLSRREKIQEETKRALELGIQAPAFVPVSENFRSEGLTAIPFSHHPHIVPGMEASFNHQGNKTGIVMGDNPHIIKLTPKILTEIIKFKLEVMNEENHGELAPEILNSFAQLTSQIRDYEAIAPLHKEVLTKVFGEAYFLNKGEANTRKSSGK